MNVRQTIAAWLARVSAWASRRAAHPVARDAAACPRCGDGLARDDDEEDTGAYCLACGWASDAVAHAGGCDCTPCILARYRGGHCPYLVRVVGQGPMRRRWRERDDF